VPGQQHFGANAFRHVFAGQETTHNNTEQRKIYYGYRVDDDWKHILGGYLDVSNEVFGARLIYMQNSIDLSQYPPDDVPTFSRGTRQRIIGLSGSIDYGNWMVRAEANRFMRPALDYKSSSFTATVGYRMGKFMPLVGFSSYKEKLTATYTATQNDNTRFAGVRWDFRKNMDLKVQWDSVKDSSAYDFTKNAKMVTVTVKTKSTTRFRRRKLRSLMRGKKGFRMFSLKLTEGASSVAEAQLLIAESRAPKNMICAKSGTIGERMRLGRMCCGSDSRLAATIFGSIRLAEYARNIGMKAKQK